MRLKVIENLELKVHYMNLQNDPFNKISARFKTIEMRLFDEKRQALKIGDIIIFTNSLNGNILKCEIINLYQFSSFEELYSRFDPIKLGYNEGDVVDYHDMEQYYPKDLITKYGVLGIEIKVL